MKKNAPRSGTRSFYTLKIAFRIPRRKPGAFTITIFIGILHSVDSSAILFYAFFLRWVQAEAFLRKVKFLLLFLRAY